MIIFGGVNFKKQLSSQCHYKFNVKRTAEDVGPYDFINHVAVNISTATQQNIYLFNQKNKKHPNYSIPTLFDIHLTTDTRCQGEESPERRGCAPILNLF